MLDVSKLPLNEKALMRLMHLDREMRDGGLPKNITVVGLEEIGAKLNAQLADETFQNQTKGAYKKQTWSQSSDTAFHNDWEQLREFITPPSPPGGKPS